jgi:hypothetical protein
MHALAAPAAAGRSLPPIHHHPSTPWRRASAPPSELEALREAGVEMLVAPQDREEGTEIDRVAAPRLQVLEENP